MLNRRMPADPQAVTLEMGPTGLLPGAHIHEFISSTDADRATELEQPLTVPAGTVALVHFDSWHRAMATAAGAPSRYMLKFHFMRTQEPTEPSWDCRDTDWTQDDGHPDGLLHSVRRTMLSIDGVGCPR